ncbi:MAG: hypothetical protein AAF412_04595 [Pseudomonadota bacterium]
MAHAQALPYSQASVASGVRFDRLTNFALGLAVFMGGFVIFEPAPYELFLSALLAIFFLLGLRISKDILPVLIPVVTFTIGGMISSFMVDDYMRGVIYNLVTLFLGLTTILFALLIKQDMGRLRVIFRGYVLAAVATAMLGIIGYFEVPGFETFTRYQRAQGAFADPNVFAPFLIMPILYLIYGVMRRSFALMPIRLGLLAILLLGELLAGSRAGWGLALVTIVLFYTLLLINEPQARMRAKYVLFGVFGLVAVIIGIIGALQIDAVWEIMVQRAKVVQDYDGARIGRFARHAIGFELALTKPLGIGNLEFGFLYGEDEHNVYMRSLLSYGWLGFASWMTIILWPMIAGFKSLFLVRPWQVYFQTAYVVFLGHLLVGWVIDIDHWRHVWLILGVMWGCILLEKHHQRSADRETAQ